MEHLQKNYRHLGAYTMFGENNGLAQVRGGIFVTNIQQSGIEQMEPGDSKGELKAQSRNGIVL